MKRPMRTSRHASVVAAAAAALLALAACTFDLTDALEGGTDPKADITGEWALTSLYDCSPADMCFGAWGSLILSISNDQLSGNAYLTGDSTLAGATTIAGTKTGAG